jgi:hypothetical protein
MEYLANPFNLSVNPAPNDGVAGIFNLVSIYLFYSILFNICNYLEDVEFKYACKSDDNIEITSELFDNIFDDETVDETTKMELAYLLDRNSLDRHYILYYIFKINNGLEYRKVANVWDTIEFSENTMSLDETLDNNYKLVIDNNKVINCNIAHIRFISWLYYSGIFKSLTTDNMLKKDVLDIMNSENILIGNLFLKYHLFLIELEEQETNSDPSSKYTSINTDEYDIPEEVIDNIIEDTKIVADLDCNDNELLETIKDADEESVEDEEEDERLSDVDLDDDHQDNIHVDNYTSSNQFVNGYTNKNKRKNKGEDRFEDRCEDRDEDSDDQEDDYEDETEEQLSNRPISEDLSDMTAKSFITKMINTVHSISVKCLISIWDITKEETRELFRTID